MENGEGRTKCISVKLNNFVRGENREKFLV